MSLSSTCWPYQQVAVCEYLHILQRKISALVDSLLSSPIPARFVQGTEPSPVCKTVGN